MRSSVGVIFDTYSVFRMMMNYINHRTNKISLKYHMLCTENLFE